MNQLIENIIPLSWLLLTIGWILHMLVLMRHIEKKRNKPTSVIWFIKNRTKKFATMLITPIPLGLIEYVIVHPPSLDLSTLQGRTILGSYLAVILMTGAGSNKVIDTIGVKNTINTITDDDDYKTYIKIKNKKLTSLTATPH